MIVFDATRSLLTFAFLDALGVKLVASELRAACARMRIIELSASPALLRISDPTRSPTLRDTFLPEPSSPTVVATTIDDMPPRRSVLKETPKSSRQPLQTVTNSIIPAFFSPTKGAVTPAARVVEFDGIEELSEADFTAEDLARSARRRQQRADARAGRSSVVTSDDVEHIDLSGPSSPPRSSLSGPLRSSSPGATPSSPIAGTRKRTRRAAKVVSENESDGEDVPPPKRMQNKGKTRATVLCSDTEGDDDPPQPPPPRTAHQDVDTSGPSSGLPSSTTAPRSPPPEDDEYDAFDADFPYDAIMDNIDAIPDFTALPATFPHRSPSLEPIFVDDDEPEVLQSTTKRAPPEPAVDLMADLTLLDAMEPKWRNFYEEHWRRGADGKEGSGDEDGGVFSVPTVVQRSTPTARGRGGTRARSWRGKRGWGRGRKKK